MFQKRKEGIKQEIVKQNILQRPAMLNGFRKIKGVEWWQLEVGTGVVKRVSFDSITAGYKAGVQNRINMKKGFLYTPAVNKTNAEKKFIKMVEELAAEGKLLNILGV